MFCNHPCFQGQFTLPVFPLQNLFQQQVFPFPFQTNIIPPSQAHLIVQQPIFSENQHDNVNTISNESVYQNFLIKQELNSTAKTNEHLIKTKSLINESSVDRRARFKYLSQTEQQASSSSVSTFELVSTTGNIIFMKQKPNKHLSIKIPEENKFSYFNLLDSFTNQNEESNFQIESIQAILKTNDQGTDNLGANQNSLDIPYQALKSKMEGEYGVQNEHLLLKIVEDLAKNPRKSFSNENFQKAVFLTFQSVIHNNFSNFCDSNLDQLLPVQSSSAQTFSALNSQPQQQLAEQSGFLGLQLQVKSEAFLKQFDFSEVRLSQSSSSNTGIHKEPAPKKQNSSYIKNSQFHNLNKLFMYNILSMFRIDSLENLGISSEIIQELSKIILRLKISSRREYKNAERGFFDYFSHGHYKVLFLLINDRNLSQLSDNGIDIKLHQACFLINISEATPTQIAYINAIKHINYQIFISSIREHLIIDDGTTSKQNTRRLYTFKVIAGIKKLSKGIPIKRF